MATYKIQSGDQLDRIALKYGTTSDALAKANNIADKNKIFAGNDLIIPDTVAPPLGADSGVPKEQAGGPSTANMGSFAPIGGGTVGVPPAPGAITTGDLSRASSLPEPTTFVQSTQPAVPLSQTVSAVAGTQLTSNQKAVDAIRAKQQKDIEIQKSLETTKVKDLEGKITDATSAKPIQDALAEIRSKFQVEETIQKYTDISNRIVAAQEALSMGLVYEQDRPVRMQLLTGRSSSLQKQGLATIGALQGTAEVLKGNLDLAKSYAETTINAINTDNDNAMSALKTLLSLHSENLVDLTKEEKKIVDERVGAIEAQNKEIEDNKDFVIDLMTKYPNAFLKGSVTLLDTRETALKKMLPTLAADERAKFNADIYSKTKETSTKTDKDGPAADKTELLQLKANGMTYEEAINAYGNTVSVEWINSVYRQDNTPSDPSAVTDPTKALYSNFLNPDGTPKSGYEVSLDKDGKPVIKAAAPAEKTGNWFTRFWTGK